VLEKTTSEAMATARCIGPWSVLVLRTLLAASYVGAMDGRGGENLLEWKTGMRAFWK